MADYNRINVAKDRRSISIIIKAKKNWFDICFLPIWLTGWTLGGLAAMRAVFVCPDRNAFPRSLALRRGGRRNGGDSQLVIGMYLAVEQFQWMTGYLYIDARSSVMG